MSDNTCTICLEPLLPIHEGNDIGATVPCGHCFHLVRDTNRNTLVPRLFSSLSFPLSSGFCFCCLGWTRIALRFGKRSLRVIDQPVNAPTAPIRRPVLSRFSSGNPKNFKMVETTMTLVWLRQRKRKKKREITTRIRTQTIQSRLRVRVLAVMVAAPSRSRIRLASLIKMKRKKAGPTPTTTILL